jgi:hypothetical protein
VPVQKKNGTVETRKSCSLSEWQVVAGYRPLGLALEPGFSQWSESDGGFNRSTQHKR